MNDVIDQVKLRALHEKIQLYQKLATKERCEDSLYEFLKASWSSIDSAEFQPGWALEGLCEHLEAVTSGQIRRLLINFPPRCCKTTITSVCWPAWTWARSSQYNSYWSGPHVKFLCASYNAFLSLDNANKMRRLLESPFYQGIWGNKFGLREDENTKSAFANTLGGARKSTSVGGSLLGIGGDIIVCLPYSERVLTSAGWLPIGDIVEQKLAVQVAGEQGGGIVWQEIEEYERNPGRATVRIKWDSGALRCTEDHLVFVEGKGYIPAQEVSVGDTVWTTPDIRLSDVQHRGSSQALQHCQVLWEGVLRSMAQAWAYPKRYLGGLFGLRGEVLPLSVALRSKREADQIRRTFLQQEVLRRVRARGQQPSLAGGSCVCTMQELRQGASGQTGLRRTLQILLDALPRHSAQAAASEAAKGLRAMWRGVYGVGVGQTPAFLYAGVCQQEPLSTNQGRKQWALRAWAGWEAVSTWLVNKVQEAYSAAGWQLLSAVFLATGNQTTHPVAGAPYQLRQRGHSSNELDHTVRPLPREHAWGASFSGSLERQVVRGVERTGWEGATYNVRVAPCHNYFAEGLLVHNCDDPHNTETEKLVETDSDRLKVSSWFKEISGTRLNDPKKSSIVVVMQRLHEGDLSGVILDEDEGEWVHLMLPMRHEVARHCVTVKLPGRAEDAEPWEDPRIEEDELLWPERFGEAEIRRAERALGPYMAAGRLQQAPTPKGGGIIKRDWWKCWDEFEARRYGLEWSPTRKEFPEMEFVLGSIDTAFGEKEENDFSAMTVWGIWSDANKNPRAMLMFAWAKRLPLHGTETEQLPNEPPEVFKARQRENWGLVEWVADTAKRYKLNRLLIEDKARGIDVANEVKRLYRREKFGVQLVTPVKDKVSRTHAIVSLFVDNGVWAPDTRWADSVITQCQSFPRAEHDDLHDTVTQALKFFRDNGLLIRAEEVSASLVDNARYVPPQRGVAERYGL